MTQPLDAGGRLLRLQKYHGLSNDFLISLENVGLDAPLARRLCERHRGVGADGVIESWPAPPGSGARLGFSLWNADGSEAEVSGNGLRCLAHAALDAGILELGEAAGVLTPAGRLEVTVVRRVGPDEVWATAGMGTPKVQGEPERCNVGHGQLLVDMGNPHLVVLGPDPAGLDVASLGPALGEGPSGLANVEFVTLGPGPDELTMRVWERGVGETLACGSGSCAAAVALHHWGRVGREVTVHQPGGALAVSISPDGAVTLSGPSQRVYSVEVVARP